MDCSLWANQTFSSLLRCFWLVSSWLSTLSINPHGHSSILAFPLAKVEVESCASWLRFLGVLWSQSVQKRLMRHQKAALISSSITFRRSYQNKQRMAYFALLKLKNIFIVFSCCFFFLVNLCVELSSLSHRSHVACHHWKCTSSPGSFNSLSLGLLGLCCFLLVFLL